MKLLPEGLAELLAPAAALPALLLLAPEDPAVTRQGEELELQLFSRPAEPPLASAAVPASASAVANPIAANFITFASSVVDFFCRVADKEKRKNGCSAGRAHPLHHNCFSLGDRGICIRTSVELRPRGSLLAPLRHADAKRRRAAC
jgi:hypothetical protein